MSNLRIYFIALLLSVSIGHLSAQIIVIDSLKKLLTGSKEDTVKAFNLNLVAIKLVKADQIQAREYAEQGLTLSKNLHFIRGEAKAELILGTLDKEQSRLEDALQKINKSISLAQSIDDINAIA
jgi:hypothetical protein